MDNEIDCRIFFFSLSFPLFRKGRKSIAQVDNFRIFENKPKVSAKALLGICQY